LGRADKASWSTNKNTPAMKTTLMRTLILPPLLWMAAPVFAQAPDCATEREACIRLAVMEAAIYVEECGKIMPDARARLEAALAQWAVLKLPIPGVIDAAKPNAPGHGALARKVGAYLKSIGSYERDIECLGRLAMMKNKTPTLRSDTVSLPRDVLEPYL
jgi:hypothetical protein